MNSKQANDLHVGSAVQRRAFYLIRLAAGYLALVTALAIGITCALASCFSWAVASDNNPVAASFGTVVLMATGALGWRLLRSTIGRVSSMPYVPPVREQISAMAAESVLVRGSAAPADDRGELLRAGAFLDERHGESLLRTVSGE